MGNIASFDRLQDWSFLERNTGQLYIPTSVIPSKVLKLIVQKANIFDLRQVSATNRELRFMAKYEVDRRVISLLESFNMNSHNFLDLLRSTGGYISGSAALAVIDPGVYTPGDLDLYVNVLKANEVWRYLWRRRAGGWRQLLTPAQFRAAGLPVRGYSGIDGVVVVWYFQHQQSGKLVNVVVTRTKSALPAILRFHSTLVMNVITHFGVVSFYRTPTTAGVGWTTKEGMLGLGDLSALDKYRERGYTILRDSRLGDFIGEHICGKDARCTQTYRCIQDDEVGVAPFAGYQHQKRTDLLRSMEDVLIWRLKNHNCYRSTSDTTALIITGQGDSVLL
ncbi:hypothetical protein CC2G_000238 [Coprinopsis cinerea AmutBmut pab1-1]|nr:hypothetical protein CC2G_000238 [Coprinopsis cinerea AmutBmut pab1-1]